MHEYSGQPRLGVAVCDSQPLTLEGLRAVIAAAPEFEVIAATTSLSALRERSGSRPALALVDKTAGPDQLPIWLAESAGRTATVVWGGAITEIEALRLIQAGARGVMRKTATPETLLTCLKTVASGQTWLEDTVFRGIQMERAGRNGLTPRERQVMELVESGMKNRDIALELGIRPGTVKIHLKHIFEKTGVRGRYGLALAGLKFRGQLSAAAGGLGV
jgi:two-component system nitrate/nitrite response regulator NarL